jgi:hypothetical protein
MPAAWAAGYGLDGTRRDQVVQGVAGGPLHHDVGVVPGVLDVEDLREPRVGQPAGGPRGGQDLLDAGEAVGEGDHGDGPGQDLVDRFPGNPATGSGDPVLKTVAAAELGPRLRDERAHKSQFKGRPTLDSLRDRT